MEDQELRKRIQGLDPVSDDVQTRAVDDGSSRQMLEGIMEQTVNSTSNPAIRYLLGAAAVAVLVLGGLALFNSEPAGPPLALSLGENDALASCIQVSPEVLAEAPLAFSGTVTTVAGETVTLEVDEWYVGGDAAVVELTAPAGLEALIGTVDFVEGESYLISAYDYTVNYCGFSGPATPELQAVYDQAFPG
jgi:hypothetical protein